MAKSRAAAVAVGLIAVASYFAFGAYLNKRHSTVWFVNALDVTVHITVGARSFSLDEGQRKSFVLDAGAYRVHVTQALTAGSEMPIEDQAVDVPGGETNAVIYNVAGAAPLYRQSVTFAADKQDLPNEEQYSFVGGERFVVADHVQWVFTDPPSTLTVDAKQSRAQHWLIDTLKDGTWSTTIAELSETKPKLAIEVATRVALLHPSDRAHLDDITDVLAFAHLASAKSIIARHIVTIARDSLEAQLYYQDALLADGERAQLIREYDPKAAKDPTALFLAARVIERQHQLGALQDAMARFPKDGRLAMMFFLALADLHHAKEALVFAPTLDKLELTEWDHALFVSSKTAVLAELGRWREAKAWLDKNSTDPGAQLAVIDKQLGGDPLPALDTLEEPVRTLMSYLYLDGLGADAEAGKDDDELRSIVLVGASLHQGVDATLKAMSDVKTLGLLKVLGRGVQLSIAGALATHGQRALAQAVLDTIDVAFSRAAMTAAVLDGKSDVELDEARDAERCGLRVALALHAKDPKARKQLLDAALADEPIPGPIHLVVARWFN